MFQTTSIKEESIQKIQFSKKQNFLIARTCIYSAIAFVIVFACSFLLSKFVVQPYYTEASQMPIIVSGSTSLLLAFIVSIIISFKGFRMSLGAIIACIFFYMACYIVSFSTLFSLIEDDVLFFSLAITSATMLITGIIGFVIKPNQAAVLNKLLMVSIGIYFIFSLSFSLLFAFVWYVNLDPLYIVISAFLGLFMVISNIQTFYQIKNLNEFVDLENQEKTIVNKLVAFTTFSLLLSMVNTFIIVLRIILLSRNN